MIKIILILVALMTVIILVSDFISDYRTRKRLRYEWNHNTRRRKARDSDSSLYESFQVNKESKSYNYLVDDQTWSDLDLQDLFRKIDISTSSLGAEFLFSKMRLINKKFDNKFEDMKEYVVSNPEERVELQLLFSKLGKSNYNNASSFVVSKATKKENYILYLCLGIFPIICLVIALFNSTLGLSLLLFSISINIIVYFTTQYTRKNNMDSLEYLVKSIYIARKLTKYNFPGKDELAKANKNFNIVSRLGFFFRDKGGISETDILFEYINIMFMLPNIAASYIPNKVHANASDAQLIIDIMSKLEAAISLAHYENTLAYYCQPQFVSEKAVLGTDLYHPLVDGAVANDANFSKNMIISGDNASGKSTYLRTVAISLITSQTLNIAFASNLSISYGNVMSSMGVSDSIETGDSYFISESKSIKRMLEALGQNDFSYFFIDELFKGTNTIERIGSGIGILNWLEDKNCIYMVSSHDVELVELMSKSIDSYHFDSQYENKKIIFDYKIKKGSAITKNAVNTLESLNYPDEITSMSKKVIKNYERNHKWEV
ncbi:hypothetical protein BG261_07865 [Floricoccus tropicus]|uniref:DNA mismatch repair proteins mutS family domain-containing protein n=1 Tax=Floricoccus tropicus TaxID=1859473 RepID=A0A1E8GIX8_9LACT|nr:hypothetical protein [Floricoccus tropicus]OFI48189.1 hypothetical protein BG261_07865 [Floricoccus tropicus]